MASLVGALFTSNFWMLWLAITRYIPLSFRIQQVDGTVFFSEAKRLEYLSRITAIVALVLASLGTATGRNAFAWVYLQSIEAILLLKQAELTFLAQMGALNKLEGVTHRRDTFWQVERAGKQEEPLLSQKGAWLQDESDTSPLSQINTEERLIADYTGTGLTVGKHPMHYRRVKLISQGILSA